MFDDLIRTPAQQEGRRAGLCGVEAGGPFGFVTGVGGFERLGGLAQDQLSSAALSDNSSSIPVMPSPGGREPRSGSGTHTAQAQLTVSLPGTASIC
jgi:hypothetical protein